MPIPNPSPSRVFFCVTLTIILLVLAGCFCLPATANANSGRILEVRGEFEFVRAKPLGAVVEMRGAVLRPFLENRMSAGANFLNAGGYTGRLRRLHRGREYVRWNASWEFH